MLRDFTEINAGDLLQKFTKCGPNVLVPLRPTPETRKYFFEAYLGWAKENMGLSNKRVALAYVTSALCVNDPERERQTEAALKLFRNIILSRRTDPLMRAVVEKISSLDHLDLEVKCCAVRLAKELPPAVPVVRKKKGFLGSLGFGSK